MAKTYSLNRPQLAKMNSIFRTIDLLCLLIAPSLVNRLLVLKIFLTKILYQNMYQKIYIKIKMQI
jgi:hypothetical protein